MTSNESNQGKLTSLSEIISPEKQVSPNKIEINNQVVRSSYVTQTDPQVTKITRKIVTSQPVTETHVTRKIITTTKIGQTNLNQNTRYNNTNSSTNKTKTVTTSYTRPSVQSTSTNSYNRYNIQNNSNNNSNNQGFRNNPKPMIKSQNNQPSRIQNSQSYSGNRNQPQRPNASSSNYRPRANSPNPGTIKIKTIIRGKPIENILITHIINSSRPLDFHITEELNMDNLNTQPIQISEDERNKLQKSGKVEVSCSCNGVDIKKKKPLNLEGRLTHYQHAQGLGMTDAKENINPQFYTSEIKELKPKINKKGEPNVEILTFRSNGKNYTTTTTIKKMATTTKPTTNYSNNRSNTSKYTQNRTVTTNTNNNDQLRSNYGKNNNLGGHSSYIKSSGTNTGRGSGKIVKETTTKVTMGSRSQFQNQSKPVVTTTSERKVYDQNNFFKKEN